MNNAVGTVVAAFGRQYDIRLDDGSVINGSPKGKKSLYACGDRVNVELGAIGQCEIKGHEPRNSLLYRSDAYRQKLIAANTTQLIFVAATEPAFSDELLSRAIVAAEHERMKVVIVLNKCDLSAGLPTARAALAPYVQLGYEVIELSAKQNIDPLLPRHFSLRRQVGLKDAVSRGLSVPADQQPRPLRQVNRRRFDANELRALHFLIAHARPTDR